MGEKAFSVVRNDNYAQPFEGTLSGGRSLDGTEEWDFSVRASKSGGQLLRLRSATGGIVKDVATFQPIVVFGPSTFAEEFFPVGDDVEYLYDLQMTKNGLVETPIIDILTLIGDITR